MKEELIKLSQEIHKEILDFPSRDCIEWMPLAIQEYIYKYYSLPKEEPKQEWQPIQGEQVWIKVFSNWSKGTYIGYDTTRSVHLIRECEECGGNLLSSNEILPDKAMPNKPKQETLEKAAEIYTPVRIEQKAFIAGVNWQQKQLHSKDDMINFAWWLTRNLGQFSDDKDAHFKGKYFDMWAKEIKKELS